VKLNFVVNADPKCSIPAWAYNLTVVGQGYTVKGIRKKVLTALAE
jgi:hypothetical protein